MPIRRAVLAVADGVEVVPLANMLNAFGVAVFATPETAAVLRAMDVPVQALRAPLGVHGELGASLVAMEQSVQEAILSPSSREDAFDLVVVGLGLPGDAANPAARADVEGLALLRSAAACYERVVVLVDPRDYPIVLFALSEGRDVDRPTRRRLAATAFKRAAIYDSRISAALAADALPDAFTWMFERIDLLSTEEGAAPRAALYREIPPPAGSLVQAMHLHDGAIEATVADYLEASAVLRIARIFAEPTVVIARGGALCAVASAASIEAAYRLAVASPSASAPGAAIAFSASVGVATMALLSASEARSAVAPDFAFEGLVHLRGSTRLRLFAAGDPDAMSDSPAFAWVAGGIALRGSAERPAALEGEEQASSLHRLDDAERRAALFAARVCSALPPCAAVLARSLPEGALETTAMSAAGASPEEAIRRAIRALSGIAVGHVLAIDEIVTPAKRLEAATFAGVTVIVLPAGPALAVLRAELAGLPITLLGVGT